MKNITDYQAQYFAYELTKRVSSDSSDKFARTVAGAQVDLNPHQVDAALFAFASPLSKGAILADEVGLGKTIEAGLVISQRWAEQKRNILIITPSNLRKQWLQELNEKFFLPCEIMETRFYNQAIKKGNFRPFYIKDKIVICSYQFARNKASDVSSINWDLIVIDEAHRLRNVYKPSNIIANTLKKVLAEKHKLLLTATPLQNSLLELFGLVSFIDEHTFGDIKSFKEQFSNVSQESVFNVLKDRLKPICHRTLRRQVNAYISYTKRYPILQEFTPEESEDKLYNLVSEYIRRPNLQALPSGQRSLMTLILRKLLASSTFAIAGALKTVSNRLQKKLTQDKEIYSVIEGIEEDYEALDETSEEWNEDEEDKLPEPLTEEEKQAIKEEIEELKDFTTLATSIEHNAKGKSLLSALDIAFKKLEDFSAPKKAVIFTESRKTQDYLLRILADSPYNEGIVLFNGSNSDDGSKEIYANWVEKYKNTDKITGSKTADMRSALVDYFRDEGRIMITTEAGAEGINLQFCSLVVNYDLPWNPQRIEQRIGRCHRYGQKHDVVVVNFLNRKNQADKRVYELLSEKFKLFDGVFGTSDEVLGAIEAGVDFEKRIADIYQKCRKADDIKEAFDKLQLELNFEIEETISNTRQKLLENFDDEVREKLKIRDEDARASLNLFEQLLIKLSSHELQDFADFKNDYSFVLKAIPSWIKNKNIPLGLYELPRRTGEAHFYRLGHPLGDAVVERAKLRDLTPAEVVFDYSNYQGKISIVEPFIGKSGWLLVSILTVSALEQDEDYIILSGTTDNLTNLDEDVLTKILNLPSRVVKDVDVSSDTALKLKDIVEAKKQSIQQNISDRNANYFEEEVEKLEYWADDLKVGLEKEIKEIDKEIKEIRKLSTRALNLEEKLEWQKKIKSLENTRNNKRKNLFEAQDEIDRKRQELIEQIEGKLGQQTETKELFTIRWGVV